MDTVEFGSKMLRSFLKAFGVTPTPQGLIEALPADVRAAVDMATQQAPVIAETTKALHDGFPRIVAAAADTHRMAAENNVMLKALCRERGLAIEWQSDIKPGADPASQVATVFPVLVPLAAPRHDS